MRNAQTEKQLGKERYRIVQEQVGGAYANTSK